ncbi:fam-a protein [Plasmodium vinckei brucechwatti]|uniref:Fam-a protein n=1 Tax=Plasmodium vinckei brucechwatti TaxID=119398 RepID=A0A6V7SKM1_PLAVN|nr:fam-a protein [Plasmodium vinckei brucechwatti]
MNKFYIKIVFFILSVSIYLNNKTLATKPDPGTATKTISEKAYSTPEEIYVKNKDKSCTNRNEIINAAKLMREAAAHLEDQATSKNGYELCKWSRNFNITLSKKKDGNTIIQRINLKSYHINKYNEIINMLWDPDSEHFLDKDSSKRKIVRMYSPNLVMIQQRYKSWSEGRDKYFYALAANVEVSPYETIIVMTSPNVNDGYPSDKEYKNRIVENASLFKTDIDSEDDIRNGEIKKTIVNLAGYFIRKIHNFVDIIYVESIDGHTSSCRKSNIKKTLNNFFSL